MTIPVKFSSGRRAIPQRIRDEKYRDNKSCWYCGCKTTTRNRQLDHLLPVALGGTNDPDNLVVCCKRCNTRKGDKTHLEYIKCRLEQVKQELETLASRLLSILKK